MNFIDFLDLAQKFAAMGTSVQAQMEDVINGEPLDDLNPNALAMILELVKSFEHVTEGGDEDSFNVKHAIEEHLGEQ
jgi:hypothetical protein